MHVELCGVHHGLETPSLQFWRGGRGARQRGNITAEPVGQVGFFATEVAAEASGVGEEGTEAVDIAAAVGATGNAVGTIDARDGLLIITR